MRPRSSWLGLAIACASGLLSCAEPYQSDIPAPAPLECRPLDLFAYEYEDSCVTSGAPKDDCTQRDATRSHTIVDGAGRSILANAVNDPATGYFGTAYRIFVIPNGPRRVTLQGTLSGIETRSDAKMQVRAGCFFEWSGSDMYNTLIPYVSREDRLAIKYSRNGTPPGDGVESLGQPAPTVPTPLALQLSVDASVSFSAASGTVRAGSSNLLGKSWTGQPAIASGTAAGFDPTKFRIFCGATVEDGDGRPMHVNVSLTDIQGTVCYAGSGG